MKSICLRKQEGLIFIFLLILPLVSYTQTPDMHNQWLLYKNNILTATPEGNNLTLTPHELVLSQNSFQNYQLTFTLNVQEFDRNQPFSLYFNTSSDTTDPLYANYRLTYTNYSDPQNNKNHGPKWRIAKKKTDFNHWDELDFFPGSPFEQLQENTPYHIKIISHQIQLPTTTLVYLSAQINNYLVCSIVDQTQPIVSGKVGFGTNNAKLVVSDITLESISFPEKPLLNKIVVFGDSIVFGNNLSRESTASSAILQKLLGETFTVLNFGFPGERTSGSLLTKWSEGRIRFQEIIDLERPEFIFIEEGTNNSTEPTVIEDLTAMVAYAKKCGVIPILSTLTPVYQGSNFADINQQIIALANKESLPLVDLWQEFTQPTRIQRDVQHPELVTHAQDLIESDLIHPTVDAQHKIGQNFYRTLMQYINTHYEAMWLKQTHTPLHKDITATLFSGQTATVEVQFKNTGHLAWFSIGPRQIALYVYRDHPWSWPQEYNLPTSLFYGTDYFAGEDWGSSIDGKIIQCRAAVLKEKQVLPGEVGSFVVNLTAPLTAKPNSFKDDPSTVFDERYYRSDFALATGPWWIHNYTNGDSQHIAHTWFAIQVIEQST